VSSLCFLHKVIVKSFVATPCESDRSECTRHVAALGSRLEAVGCNVLFHVDISCRLR
jgi:hypothetical protein